MYDECVNDVLADIHKSMRPYPTRALEASCRRTSSCLVLIFTAATSYVEESKEREEEKGDACV